MTGVQAGAMTGVLLFLSFPTCLKLENRKWLIFNSGRQYIYIKNISRIIFSRGETLLGHVHKNRTLHGMSTKQKQCMARPLNRNTAWYVHQQTETLHGMPTKQKQCMAFPPNRNIAWIGTKQKRAWIWLMPGSLLDIQSFVL
jgi:hypothetical protein